MADQVARVPVQPAGRRSEGLRAWELWEPWASPLALHRAVFLLASGSAERAPCQEWAFSRGRASAWLARSAWSPRRTSPKPRLGRRRPDARAFPLLFLAFVSVGSAATLFQPAAKDVLDQVVYAAAFLLGDLRQAIEQFFGQADRKTPLFRHARPSIVGTLDNTPLLASHWYL
jgi:hypothetical protein